MPSKIQILPENLCNQIAAGEVVERPASVVKELLENSLDAGAETILVEVEKGGKRLIRVVDDGCGMTREDAFLCLERHATSKIASDEDLFRLRTLGFRGEALPSIAAVSRLTLRSRSVESESGMELYLEAGTVRRADPVGMACGTNIEVRDLFFRMPARRKFLRRDETELGHIGDVVTRLALAHPKVGFRLQHQGRNLLEVFRNESREQRVASLLGRALLQDLVSVDVQAARWRLTGLVSQPSANRATTGHIFTFVNGRFIRDRVVQHAILHGYRNLLLKGRYPVVVLFLDLDPELVDVNVHPTKHEVRFREQGEVHDFIADAVRNALREPTWLAGPQPETGREEKSQSSIGDAGRAVKLAQPMPVAETRRLAIREAMQSYARIPAPESQGHRPGPVAADEPRSLQDLAAETPLAPSRGFFSSLQLIGQYHHSYLLCQDGDDLLLIDQHAAHERIGFERLKTQWQAGSVTQQRLLFPLVMEFSHQELAQLGLNQAHLDRLGFELEPFGGKAFALKAMPQLLSQTDAERLLRDVAGELAQLEKSAVIEEAVDQILILMACHGMIRANQSLAPAEMKALLRDLDQIDFSAQCPHGRPVVHRLTLGQVERFFKRA